jgi:hypothetical protein
MNVASEQGFLDPTARGTTLGTVRPAAWGIGEIQFCRKVKFTLEATGEQDLLICGTDTDIAWDMLTDDEKHGGRAATVANETELKIVNDAKTFAVVFRGSGPLWRCKKTADGLDCA